MAEEITPHTSFELTAMAAQLGSVEPRCHEADRIYNLAETALTSGYRYKTPSGLRVRTSTGYKTNLAGVDVELSLMRETPRSESWAMTKALFAIVFNKEVNVSPITLAINEDINQGAALILPPGRVGPSASVVVGDMINNPEHLEAILPIVQTLGIRQRRVL